MLIFATQVTPQGHYVLGSLFVLFAALVWAIYALAQKQLLNALSSRFRMKIADLGAGFGYTTERAPAVRSASGMLK